MANVNFNFLVGQSSIFEAYSTIIKSPSIDDEDIVILCHDDIDILTPYNQFPYILKHALYPKSIGFVGVAGTTNLTENAVWWDREQWNLGNHRGFVFHGDDHLEMVPTHYGHPYNAQVAILDGLFLAAKAKVLRDIGLEKPVNFEGEWDYYDIVYTKRAHENGYENHVLPLLIRHASFGDLAGRESWYKNRDSFIKETVFPITL